MFFHRYIVEQLQQEADAREALPYVSVVLPLRIVVLTPVRHSIIALNHSDLCARTYTPA